MGPQKCVFIRKRTRNDVFQWLMWLDEEFNNWQLVCKSYEAMMVGDLFFKTKSWKWGIILASSVHSCRQDKVWNETCLWPKLPRLVFLKERRFTMDVSISQARFTGQVWSLVRYFRNFAAIRLTLMGWSSLFTEQMFLWRFGRRGLKNDGFFISFCWWNRKWIQMEN